MSKADFEFYNLGEHTGLVRPHFQNDPYDAMFNPAEGVFVQNGLNRLASTSPYDMEVDELEVGKLDDSFTFLLKIYNPKGNLPVYMEHVNVRLLPAVEQVPDPLGPLSLPYLPQVYDLVKSLIKPKPTHSPEQLDGVMDEEGNQVQGAYLARGLRVDRTLNEFAYLVDHTDTHYRNPTITWADFMHVRAYRWEAGPLRKGSALPPVYNPQRFDLLVGASVRVEVVNPHSKPAAE